MDISAKPYRILVAVADLGSFSRAADALHISQPALSAQMRELERQLGFDLFHRTTRRVTLTREGRVFLDYARRMVMEAEWMLRAAREIRGRPLMIGVPHHSYLMPDRVALTDGFAASHAAARPVRIMTRHPRQLIAELREDMLDAALMLGVSGHDGHLAFDQRPADLDMLHLARRPVAIAAPEGDELARHARLTAAELTGRTILIFTRTHGVGVSEAVTRGLAALGAEVRHAPEGDAMSVRRHAARIGAPCVDLGWFQQPAADAAMAAMRSVPVDWSLATDLLLLHRPDPDPDTARFVDHCLDWRDHQHPAASRTDGACPAARGMQTQPII